MADGPPKDYSIMDQEDSGPPLPRIRSAQSKNQWSDGFVSVPRHRESGVDLAAVARRLRALPMAEIANDSIRHHYSDVFGNRKQEEQPPLPPPPPPSNSSTVKYKAVIHYVEEDEKYIINVPQNTAKVVKSLAPKRGNYRYFFELTDGAYEEVELGDTKVPVHQKNKNMDQCVKLTTKISSLDYNMNHNNRGFCIIFDNENFEKLPKRHGSQKDSTGLYNLFRSMSFDVKIYKDKPYKDIKRVLEYYSREDHTDNDCFVCCILSHGEHGELWAADKKFPIDTLFNYFLGNNCRTLVGKPKMFFVQACQGDRLDDGVAVIAGDAEDATTAYFSIPTHADFLIAYSTIPGFFSWRNTQDGSWFMQAVIAILSEYHHDLDLLTMLTMVNHRVAFFKSSNAETEEYNRKKQVPCITSMLTRRVFLRPKPIFLPTPSLQPISKGELIL